MAAQVHKFLSFALEKQTFAVPITSVREINQMTEITPIPKTPSFVKGVINLRGKIVPVVDLKTKLGMTASEASRMTCIVVIETESGRVGAIVDQVSDVVEFADDAIERSVHVSGNQPSDFVNGVGKLDERVIVILDIVGALSKDEFLKSFEQSKQKSEAA